MTQKSIIENHFSRTANVWKDNIYRPIRYQKIFDYFEAVAGLDHHYATSKIERGEELIRKYNIPKKKTIMIGDTIHDFEVAEKLGIPCVLIANGHQSEERLRSTGSPVISDLTELLKNGLI